MSVSQTVINFFDSMLSWLSSVSSESASSFCEIETVDTDGKTLVASDGSLATVINLKGSSRMVGDEEYHQIIERLTNTLSSFMKSPGHSLQIYFSRDPDGAYEVVRSALQGPRNQSKLLNLDFEDVFDEKERELSKWISEEAVYFVCWTHPGVFSSAESKAAQSIQKSENSGFNGLNFGGAQNPRATLSALRNGHSNFVSSLLTEMKDVNLVAEEMNAHGALREIRKSVDPHWTPRSWKPTVPGDKIPVKFPIRVSETSAVWWPPIGSQVWPRDADVIDTSYVKIGDRIHAPMYVEVPAMRVEPFQKLIQRTNGIDNKMPFTISFVLKGGGLRGQTLKGTIASVFAVMSSFNSQIRDSLSQLKELEKTDSIVSLQIAFNTWAPSGQEDLLRLRASRMAQAMIDWGGSEVRQVTGDPVEGFTSSALGLTANSIGVPAAAPLMDVVPLFPITRPASPWPVGAELFTSVDGKLMPYQPGSAIQTTWINLYLGGPGSGKSMQMFKQHLATILAPQGGVNKIPQIGIIDIGPSSSGLASMLKNALPANQRHYVNHYRLRNTVEFAYNPFDLFLGMEKPLPEERSVLVDLLTMVATPAETGVPYEGTAELAGLVVDVMYSTLANSEKGNPHRYNAGVDPVVDRAISVNSIILPSDPCWYEVRDALYAAGITHEATMAQRYAVPVLSDAASASRSPEIRDVYGKKLTAGEGSETLPEAFSRMIQSAGREYLILSQPTKFDIGESLITILDLDEVAKSGGPAGAKQTAVMYALAIYMQSKNFTLTEDNLKDMPDKYRKYHYARVQSNKKELKTICCDEFHRTSQSFSTMLRERIKVLAREGRKYNIQLMLGSQRLKDFDAELIDLATAIFIMDRPDEGIIKEYVERFGLSDTERYALANSVKSPRAGGATFFVRMKTKEGYFNQLLRNPAGPIELWAGSTTSEDKDIRDSVYAALGPVEGRSALASAYPGGSAKSDVDQRKELMILRGTAHGGGNELDLFAQISNEIIDKYQKRRADTLKAEIDEQVERKKKIVAMES